MVICLSSPCFYYDIFSYGGILLTFISIGMIIFGAIKKKEKKYSKLGSDRKAAATLNLKGSLLNLREFVVFDRIPFDFFVHNR